MQDAKNYCLSLLDLAGFLQVPPKALLKEVQKIDKGSLQALDPGVVRKILYKRGFRFPKKVISFQMLKGGVAKTTSALNFGIRASMYGAQVLFIDLDQQANLTFALGVDSEDVPVWIDVVEKKTKIQDAVIEVCPGVDLIPSSLNNSVLDRVLLNSNRNWAQAVKGPLSEIQSKYDLIIIDTAPNLSATNTAVTCASDIVTFCFSFRNL